MKTRLQKLLEYHAVTTKTQWSYTPGPNSVLDVERFAAGLPPFKVTEEAKILRLKTLIISSFEGCWKTPQETNAIFIQLRALLKKSHAIYCWYEGRPVLFDKRFEEFISAEGHSDRSKQPRRL